jgi:hypothetical protein
MKKTFFLLVFVVGSMLLFLTSGKEDSIEVRNTVFKAGELVNYDIYYNWGFIWINAGKCNFSVGEVNYKKKPAYKFYVAGSSITTFDKFYKVRDTLMSIADQESLLPYYYKRVTHEDTYWAQDEYFFTETGHKTSLITDCRRRKGKRNIDTLSFNHTVTDLITVIYRVRNLPFDKMQINEKHPFSIVYDDDDKAFNLSFRYVGKGNVELRNGREYRCIMLRPVLITGGMFKDQDGMTIYLSDDANRIPIMIESKIRVGSVKAMLNKAQNTLYPLNCEVKKKD